ncbi:hypothetical protein ACFQ0B_51210 [Nonomuraea thailandensis]
MSLDSVTGYHVGGTVNIDTGDGGGNLESRTITAIGASDITFTPRSAGPTPPARR